MATPGIGNLDSRATGEILRIFAELWASGQSLLVVTHDARVASTADRLVTMRDGALVGHTRLDGGTSPASSVLADLVDPGGPPLMRSLRLAVRLARRNLRRRPAQAALLLLTLTLATGTFGVGMALYGSADRPWNRVWAATDGFHVSANY